MAVFFEVYQNESVDVYLQFGRAFRDFLYNYLQENQLKGSVSSIENQKYQTSIEEINAHFDRVFLHETMMRYVLKNIGIENIEAASKDYEKLLLQFFKEKKIAEVKAKIKVKKNNTNEHITYLFKIEEKKLSLSVVKNESKVKNEFLAVKLEQQEDFEFYPLKKLNSADKEIASNEESALLKQIHDQLSYLKLEKVDEGTDDTEEPKKEGQKSEVHFINVTTGKYLGTQNVTGFDTAIVGISQEEYLNLVENNFSTLENAYTKTIAIDRNTISQHIKEMHTEINRNDEGEIVENNMYLIYDKTDWNNLKITSKKINHPDNETDKSENPLDAKQFKDGTVPVVEGNGKLIVIGQLHSHPAPKEDFGSAGSVNLLSKKYNNEAGVSEEDFKFSVEERIPVHAIASYMDNSLDNSKLEEVDIFSITYFRESFEDYIIYSEKLTEVVNNPTKFLLYNMKLNQ